MSIEIKRWLLSDEEYDLLNPPDNIWVIREDDLKVFYELINDDRWCWVGYIPTPQNNFGWFIYHIIHGVWMKYPLWKVVLFALDEENYSRLEIAAQQPLAPDVAESPRKCTTEKLCPVHNVWHAAPPRR